LKQEALTINAIN